MSTNRQLIFAERPSETLSKDNFRLEKGELPKIEDGQVLVKNIVVSIDPTQRIWAGEGPQYMPELPVNVPMRAGTCGVVVESKHADYQEGDVVIGSGMVQDYYVGIPGQTLNYKITPKPQSIEEIGKYMSVLSVIIGLTAYAGVFRILKPDEKSIVLVSGAAGAVGSQVCQMCKILGAKVIATTGSDEKAEWLKSELGVDEVFNYKKTDLVKAFKEVAPNGITHYFDNTAGDVTEAFMLASAIGAKACICGAIAEYNSEKPIGIRNWSMFIIRRLQITGMLVMDHLDALEEFWKWAGPKVESGELKYRVDIREGLENYPDVVNELFTGGNKGKLLLKINDL